MCKVLQTVNPQKGKSSVNVSPEGAKQYTEHSNQWKEAEEQFTFPVKFFTMCSDSKLVLSVKRKLSWNVKCFAPGTHKRSQSHTRQESGTSGAFSFASRAPGLTHVEDVPHVDGRQVVLLGAVLQGTVQHVVQLQVTRPFFLTPPISLPLGPLLLLLPFLTLFIVLLLCKQTKNITRISKQLLPERKTSCCCLALEIQADFEMTEMAELSQ